MLETWCTHPNVRDSSAACTSVGQTRYLNARFTGIAVALRKSPLHCLEPTVWVRALRSACGSNYPRRLSGRRGNGSPQVQRVDVARVWAELHRWVLDDMGSRGDLDLSR
ncbi:hypothetical protein GCM10009646_56820 [Streptomyces aureus]